MRGKCNCEIDLCFLFELTMKVSCNNDLVKNVVSICFPGRLNERYWALDMDFNAIPIMDEQHCVAAAKKDAEFICKVSTDKGAGALRVWSRRNNEPYRAAGKMRGMRETYSAKHMVVHKMLFNVVNLNWKVVGFEKAECLSAGQCLDSWTCRQPLERVER